MCVENHLTVIQDIGNSGDGGIYAQILENNGFQGDDPGLTAWQAVDDNANLSQDTDNPLNSAITSTLKVAVPDGAEGMTGVINTAYGGFAIEGDTFNCTFFIKGDYDGDIQIDLLSADDATNYGSGNVSVSSNSDGFTIANVLFDGGFAPNGNNIWRLTFDSSLVAGSALNIGLPTLFGTTFNDRYASEKQTDEVY
jgi:alpha-L-arabinofuranosidase